MPHFKFGKYGVFIRTNEHIHKKQRAHVHLFYEGVEVGSMFLDGELKEGDLRNRDLKVFKRLVEKDKLKYQSLWDEYQESKH